MIHLIVNTRPIAKARPRFSRKSGSVYTPKKTGAFEYMIAIEARKQLVTPMMGALKVKIVFSFIRAKSNKQKHHIIKPDIDNLVKSTLDALNKIAFKDDCQVVSMQVEKNYADKESVEIFIEGIE